MRRYRRHPTTLFSSPDQRVFSSILVVFALFVAMTPPGMNICTKGGDGPNLPKIAQPVKMPAAQREEAMIVVVRRDGGIYFGSDQVT